ncbi:MAG: hypothetical protein LC776_04650, partial [Acidobacteria bacterium]|nr:hypothetical protein [Acidobacteriota bacterium]
GLGLVSIALLVFAVIEFRVNWEGKSQSHSEAVTRLGRLKAKFREAHADSSDDCWSGLSAEYATTMQELPAIPERSFAKLKALHEHKRELSREISKHPSVPAALLSLQLRWRALCKMTRKS